MSYHFVPQEPGLVGCLNPNVGRGRPRPPPFGGSWSVAPLRGENGCLVRCYDTSLDHPSGLVCQAYVCSVAVGDGIASGTFTRQLVGNAISFVIFSRYQTYA